MSFIQVLDEATINKIAAGEVVERPKAVVKELVENAMDAGATAITVEIKEGGLSLIRVTDNGKGIDKDDIDNAFLRHATSKIRTAEDLIEVRSLGFRGEALSSIVAVAQVELITKTGGSLNGYRYSIEGGTQKSLEEIGCPDGTTIVVRNLFYNTPARRKFLKSPVTEAGYISDLMERLMVSHPDISFKYINNNQVKLQSSGNNNTKDILYNLYGRDLVKDLLVVDSETIDVKINGYIGKPIINRGNRNCENYFINGRYIKSPILIRAIEDAYKPYMMQHKYTFTSLYFEIEPSLIDVNVHPQKLEIRFKNGDEIYQQTFDAIKKTLAGKEMIPSVTLGAKKKVDNTIPKVNALPEPFEENRRAQIEDIKEQTSKATLFKLKEKVEYVFDNEAKPAEIKDAPKNNDFSHNNNNNSIHIVDKAKQINMFSDEIIADKTISADITSESNKSQFLSEEAFKNHRIIGQVFQTYWLVEFDKELFIIDQHAAHEKVLYERIMAGVKDKTYDSQMLMPPIVLTLTLSEQDILNEYKEEFEGIGYEFEPFGGNEISVRAVPANLYGLSEEMILKEFIDEFTSSFSNNARPSSSVMDKIASLSCKAAVKANHVFSLQEATTLIKELLTLEDPYHCPHGRPVIISMSRYELERKFKRII
ncbi:MAG: DNA mismatch repair endonuclease MutL [Clostridiales bacterium]|nr:DNA mismatch repair endonuclease MutL [Clostridiales bacterium]